MSSSTTTVPQNKLEPSPSQINQNVPVNNPSLLYQQSIPQMFPQSQFPPNSSNPSNPQNFSNPIPQRPSNSLNIINSPKPKTTSTITSSSISSITPSESQPEINKTPLKEKFSFWYRIDESIQAQTPKQLLNKKEFENKVKKIAEFDTVEDFWAIFQHLRKPDSCKPGIEFQMFKEPIKPMWEDENNKNGGKFSIKLKKEYTTIIWEEMIFALIGGILPDGMKEVINGIVVTSRKEYNTLQIWFKSYDNDTVNDLSQCIRDLLQIPPEVNFLVRKFVNNKKDYGNKGKYYNKDYNNYNKDYKYNYGKDYNDYNDYKEHHEYKEYRGDKYYNNDDYGNMDDKKENNNYRKYKGHYKK